MYTPLCIHMGWLQVVGSLTYRSLMQYRLFCRALLQQRPIILRSLLIVATPYLRHTPAYTPHMPHPYLHTYATPLPTCMYVCMYGSLYVCMYDSMYPTYQCHTPAYAGMYVCMYAYMYVCMYVWLLVCMYVCMAPCTLHTYAIPLPTYLILCKLPVGIQLGL